MDIRILDSADSRVTDNGDTRILSAYDIYDDIVIFILPIKQLNVSVLNVQQDIQFTSAIQQVLNLTKTL